MSRPIKINCYQCEIEGRKNSVLGDDPFFPFCSQECKEKWGLSHFKGRKIGSRFKTIKDCQQKLKELGEMARQRRIKNGGDIDSTYEQAKIVF